MSAMLDYKCPNCGGAIKFNSSSQQFQCESCDSVFTEAQLSQYLDMLNSAQVESSYNWQQSGDDSELEDINSYSCQSCGAQIVTDKTTAASSCPYCGSTVIMVEQLSGMNKPNYVIPFKLDKAQATAALKSFYKGKAFLPKIFTDENKIKEMKPVYVPFWLFDCDTNANISYDAVKVRHWSDSNYNYTETIHYNVFRSGSIGFADIPVDGSTKMDDSYMDGIEPFNYSEMVPFNPAYLSGFLADKYDVDAQASFPRAEDRVSTSAANEFAKTVTGYSSVTVLNSSFSATNACYKYALLPVWLFTTKFEGKNILFAINGQTGKVAGKLPVDKKKFWLTFAGIAAAAAAVGQIFVLLM